MDFYTFAKLGRVGVAALVLDIKLFQANASYRKISYHDNLALSYRINSRYYVFKIIVLYRIFIFHLEDYRIISNFV